MNAEQERLAQARNNSDPWKKWGPYLSERQWATVREDYSADGNAWSHFPHEHARSRAYCWGEDGLAGICDSQGVLCFALALWNGNDPFLKERLFGLTNSEGNHGEDVKEYYYYLDSTPTHSYMKYLYKYPIAAFPYEQLVHNNRARTRSEPEYELIDTGVFDDDEYFDVFVQYAKGGPEDVAIKISVCNRSPHARSLHVLPTFWFRNTWSSGGSRPVLRAGHDSGHRLIHAEHSDERFVQSLSNYRLFCAGKPDLLFTENDTNEARLHGGPNATPYVKDAFHDYLIAGRHGAINPESTGTKATAHYALRIEGRTTEVVRLRLMRWWPPSRPGSATKRGLPTHVPPGPFVDFDSVVRQRMVEANEFYSAITPATLSTDETRVVRQALAGMLWSKQHYVFDVDAWLRAHGANPLHLGPFNMRNAEWFHMLNDDIISMPDKWEYPWYASWDLAFHTLALSLVDVEFAKHQLDLMLTGRYLHPNGQVPAHEWNFSEVNPPVHAWATLFMHRAASLPGYRGIDFLKATFSKLTLNFTWWMNRKDQRGNSLLQGGYLALDNFAVLDRSAPLPDGSHLEQVDGTAWMAFYTQSMAELATEIAAYDISYQDMAAKFLDHFLLIAAALNAPDGAGMWDEEDGFYYDRLRFPDGSATRIKIRSVIGLLPLCATRVVEPWQRDRVPQAAAHFRERLRRRPELMATIHPTGEHHRGVKDRSIIALLSPERLRRILSRMLDESEFLSPYGIRSLSKFHAEHPYVLDHGAQDYRVGYEPGESQSGMFGGNANWRGPIWIPTNLLIVSGLLNYYLYYGDEFLVEYPTGSGRAVSLFRVAKGIADRLASIFLRNDEGRRPVFGDVRRFQTDPHFRDYIPFHEFFHAETGAGLGASHQTGWTGVIANIIQTFAVLDEAEFLHTGRLKRSPERRVGS